MLAASGGGARVLDSELLEKGASPLVAFDLEEHVRRSREPWPFARIETEQSPCDDGWARFGARMEMLESHDLRRLIGEAAIRTAALYSDRASAVTQ